MIIGDRLRALRESKKLSQGDIEERTGLLRCYTSRVECNHTVPSIETLEKYARALGVPMYQLFYDSNKPPVEMILPSGGGKQLFGETPAQSRLLTKLRQALTRISPREVNVVLAMANQMGSRTRSVAAHRKTQKKA